MIWCSTRALISTSTLHSQPGQPARTGSRSSKANASPRERSEGWAVAIFRKTNLKVRMATSMKRQDHAVMNCLLLAIAIVLLPANSAWATPTEQVVHSFTGADGLEPEAGLVLDNAGSLYGTTFGGGASPVGTVFKLAPIGGCASTQSVLFHLAGGTDGGRPVASLTLHAVPD